MFGVTRLGFGWNPILTQPRLTPQEESGARALVFYFLIPNFYIKPRQLDAIAPRLPARPIIRAFHRFRSSQDVLWRVEIHFKSGGSAWLIPNKISNRAEVLADVAALPCEHKTVRV